MSIFHDTHRGNELWPNQVCGVLIEAKLRNDFHIDYRISYVIVDGNEKFNEVSVRTRCENAFIDALVFFRILTTCNPADIAEARRRLTTCIAVNLAKAAAHVSKIIHEAKEPT